ncbi:MAG: hypothetical protein M3494_01270 [Actinomycetota bacterium]|jgi:hypothetical protein|nr:hypothetical protein [Rubrobacter sp.]MDQ3506639.1 hypothetical protein [Actinomycetota bacterium]
MKQGVHNISGPPPSLAYAAAGLSILAALIHLWMMPMHVAASVGYGAFFAALAFAQGLYGVALIRWPSRPVALLGAWGTLAVFVFYAAERVIRESFGPHAAHASGVELLAMLCTAAQLGLLSALLMDAKRTLYAAEALSFGVALIHLWEAQERYAEWWGFGAFFLSVGVGGAVYCLLLPHLGGREGFLLAGVSMNLLLVAVWFATRAAGIPYVGTDGVGSSELRLGATEGVGVWDLTATTMEVALVVLLAALASNLRRLGPEAEETAQAYATKTPSIKERQICHQQDS